MRVSVSKLNWKGDGMLPHLQWTEMGPSCPNCSLVLCTCPMKSMKPSPDLGTPCSGQSVNWNCRTVLDWPSWETNTNTFTPTILYCTRQQGMDVFIRTEADSRADTGFNSAANRWAGETLTDEDESDGQDRETSDRREAQAEPGKKAKEARDTHLQSESEDQTHLITV